MKKHRCHAWVHQGTETMGAAYKCSDANIRLSGRHQVTLSSIVFLTIANEGWPP